VFRGDRDVPAGSYSSPQTSVRIGDRLWDEPQLESFEERRDSFEMAVGRPQCRPGCVRGYGDLEVRERERLTEVAKFGGEQAHALPGVWWSRSSPRQAGQRRDQRCAVRRTRADDELGDDGAAAENLSTVKRQVQLLGEAFRAGPEVRDPDRRIRKDHDQAM
jgi:hypothetical protein